MSDLHFESVEKNNTVNGTDVTNPKYIGPGTWNVIHTLAYNATTKSAKEAFIKHMTIICKQFPCETCRGHCKQYLKENPMSDYVDVITEGKALGLFTWSWQFHNAVNFRIGKPLMTWEMALHIYSQFKSEKSDGVCSRECSDSDKKSNNVKSKKSSHKPLFRLEKEKRYYAEHQAKNGSTMPARSGSMMPARSGPTMPDKVNKKVKNYNELH